MIMGGGDKKKIAALIVSRVRPKGDVEDMKARNADAFQERAKEPELEPEKDTGLLSGADELKQAIDSGDARGIADAFKHMMTLCEGMEDESEGEGEASPDLE